MDETENITLSEISQTQKDRYYTPLIWGTRKGKFTETQKNRGYRGLRGGRNGDLLFHGYNVSIFDDENALEVDSGNGCTQCEYN